MSSSLKTFISILLSVLVSTTIIYFVIYAGSLSPSSTPADTMKTLDDIYHKLTSGSGDSFGLNPPASPTSTMHTLQNIYDAAPDFNASAGVATNTDVKSGITYYTNSATIYTGTANCVQTATPTASTIKSGESVCGVSGTLTPAGTAVAGDCESGVTFYSGDSWVQKTGTLTSLNPGTGGAFCIPSLINEAEQNGCVENTTTGTQFCTTFGLTCLRMFTMTYGTTQPNLCLVYNSNASYNDACSSNACPTFGSVSVLCN